ncbi:MAG: hypothetical protein SFV51_10545 [Bryobacteraceae bacterium]|nr:hypothetical protein [Bryobacteraceae bacterium]
MKDGYDFDGALKEVFQLDRPSVMSSRTGGVAVREFLNVELPKVQRRRVNLALLLANETILHLEFHGKNDPDLPYREGIYCLLLSQNYRRPVHQVVLYVGQAKMNIPDHLDAGGTKVTYRVIDIREFRAGDMLRTGQAGDIALAVLGGGGSELLAAILKRANALKGPQRERVLAMILLLSGLRRLAGRVELEMKRMGVIIDVEKNPVLMKWRRAAIAEGRAEGRAERRTRRITAGSTEIEIWPAAQVG